MFSQTDKVETNEKFWKIKPIRRRSRVSSASEALARLLALNRTSPEVGRSKAPRMASRVVFPDPEGPVRTEKVPSPISMETPSKARTSALVPARKYLQMFRVAKTGVPLP